MGVGSGGGFGFETEKGTERPFDVQRQKCIHTNTNPYAYVLDNIFPWTPLWRVMRARVYGYICSVSACVTTCTFGAKDAHNRARRCRRRRFWWYSLVF